MKSNQLARACALVLCSASTAAVATNGYFLPGFGMKATSMGGVGIAYAQDAMGQATNPAGLVKVGMRGDLDLVLFNPVRSAEIFETASASGGFGFDTAAPGGQESDKEWFIMPNLGMAMPLTDRIHAGFAMVANGGMNTTYRKNLFDFGGLPGDDTTLGVDFAQLLAPISVAFKVNDDHALGASLVLGAQRFEAYGLQAFNFFNVSSDTQNFTNKGFDWGFGAGIRVGWLGDFLDDRLNIGLTAATKTYMTKFDRYAGLFAEQGKFDVPANYGIGIAFHPTPNLTFAVDAMRILYSQVPSVANRGPDSGVSVGGVPCINTNPNDPNNTGRDQGCGFGWTDQTVYKLGVKYRVNDKLDMRLGYNYGKSPIPDDQLTFNILAPAVVEKHFSIGGTYKLNENLEISGTYMYVPPAEQIAVGQNIVDGVHLSMHQNIFGLSFGWVLDPGPNN